MTDKTVILYASPVLVPPALDDGTRARIAALALRQRKANGVLLKAINFVGGQVEDGLKMLPKPLRDQLNEVTRNAMRRSYDIAARSRGGIGQRFGSDQSHRIIGTLSGAIGGFGGLPTALAELPVATTLIFRAVLHVGTVTAPRRCWFRVAAFPGYGDGNNTGANAGMDTRGVGNMRRVRRA